MIVCYILAQGKISAPTVCLSIIYFDYKVVLETHSQSFFLQFAVWRPTGNMSAKNPKVRANRQRQRPRPVTTRHCVTGLSEIQTCQATAKPVEAKAKAKAKAEPKAKVEGLCHTNISFDSQFS